MGTVNSARRTKNKGSLEKRKSPRITVSLAIDEPILNDIRETAEADGLSLNSKVNSILTKWVHFFRYSEEQRTVTLAIENFQELIESTDKRIFINVLRDNLANLIPAVFMQRNIPFTVDNLIDYEFKAFGVIGGAYQGFSCYKDTEGDITLVFRHRYGPKWSKILDATMPQHVSSVLNCSVSSIATPYAVKIKLLEKNLETRHCYSSAPPSSPQYRSSSEDNHDASQ
jgi:hypothetical protein